MEPIKKIKVSIVVKKVSDRQDKEIAENNGDAYLVMNQIRKLLDAVRLKNEEEDKEVVIKLLNAAKLSNEVMANAFAEIDRDDLFGEKYNTITAIDEIIETINNL